MLPLCSAEHPSPPQVQTFMSFMTFNISSIFQNFLENLAPFPDMTENEITEYLWEKSVELEPRGTETLRKKSTNTVRF